MAFQNRNNVYSSFQKLITLSFNFTYSDDIGFVSSKRQSLLCPGVYEEYQSAKPKCRQCVQDDCVQFRTSLCSANLDTPLRAELFQ